MHILTMLNDVAHFTVIKRLVVTKKVGHLGHTFTLVFLAISVLAKLLLIQKEKTAFQPSSFSQAEN